MSVNDVLELAQVYHLNMSPEQTVGQYVQYALGAAALAGSFVARHRVNRDFDRAVDKYAASFADQSLVNESYQEVTSGVAAPEQLERKHRLGGANTTVLLGGLAAATLFLPMTYETNEQDTAAEAVVVVDESSSMLYTSDMEEGQTRHAATLGALDELSEDYDGRLAIVQAASGTEIATNMSNDWATRLPTLEEPTLDPNGGDVLQAIDEGANLLSRDEEGNRAGALTVVTDGTVSAAPKEIDKAITKLESEGVAVQVIMPGTTDASYKRGSVEAGSSIQPQMFESTEAAVVTSSDELAEALDQGITSEAAYTEQHKSFALSGALAIATVVAGIRQYMKFGKRRSITPGL